MILTDWHVSRPLWNEKVFRFKGKIHGHPDFDYDTEFETPAISSITVENDRISFELKGDWIECFYSDFDTNFYDELEDAVQSLGTEEDISTIQNYFSDKVTFSD